MAEAISEPTNYDRFKIKSAGSFVNTVPRFINIGSGLLITEDVLNDRLDLALGNIGAANITPGSITNTEISATAAIAKTKLAALGIVNADVAAGAAIDYSKLTLTGAVLNADLAGSIAHTKLAQITDMAKLPPTLAFESIEETGVIVGNDATPASMGYGLLSNPVNDTTPSQITDGNGGGHLNYNTTTTQETRVGLRTSRTITVRQVNPEFFCKFAIPSITALAGFIGFSSQSEQVNTDPALLTNVHGFGLTWRTTSSSLFRVSRNAGGPTTTITDLATALTSDPISVWMKLSDDLAKIDYKIWTASDGDPSLAAPTVTGNATTNLPSINIQMYYHFCTANVTTTSKTLDHWVSKIRTTGEHV